jgi:hypothetical protein
MICNKLFLSFCKSCHLKGYPEIGDLLMNIFPAEIKAEFRILYLENQ